jgi:eukaryotic-like serine/threonine-protein kinase
MPLGGGAKLVIARLADSPLDAQTVIGTGGNILQARFVPSGHLVYGQSPGIVRAVPFDLASLSVTGSPVSMVNSVERAMNGGGVYFAVSQTGLLVYASTGDRHQLVWVDREGVARPITSDRAPFRLPRVSPDGKLIAVAISDDTRRSDIWVYDAERGTKRRLTTENHNLEPVWTPDGTRLTVSTGPAIVELLASGSKAGTVLLPRPGYPSSWSPDGQSLLYYANAATGMDLWMLPRSAGGTPRPLLVRPGSDAFAQFSPDGRWVAYASDESGRSEVYVGRFPDLGGKVAVSIDGGTRPRWSRDGHELFYRQGDALMTVAVDGNRDFRPGKPQRLFAGNFSGESHELAFDVSPDGRQFVMIKSDEDSTLRQLTVVQNWFEELKKLVPTK